MKVEQDKFSKAFTYLSGEGQYNETFDELTPFEEIKSTETIIAFGRADRLVPARTAEVYRKMENLTGKKPTVVLSGGIGKDSGYLTDLKTSEATFMYILLKEVHGIEPQIAHVDYESTNGGECCRNSIGLIKQYNLSADLTTVTHATSARRVASMLGHIGVTKDKIPEAIQLNIQTISTKYNFDPLNPVDQKEATDEMLRFYNWGKSGGIPVQKDLPHSVVEYLVEFKKADPSGLWTK